MVIAINCRHLSHSKLEGFGTYTFELITRWIEQHQDVRFILIFDRTPQVNLPDFPHVKKVICGPPTRHPFLYWLWFELTIPRILKREKATLFFSPDGYNSLRAKIPSVITVHDLNFVHNPSDLPRFLGTYLRYYFPKFIHKAQRVLTVSDFSNTDIVTTYGLPKEKLSTIYNGANAGYRPLTNEELTATRNRISAGRPYFLFVGSLHPRKNVQRLIDAYQALENPSVDLVIVGSAMWRNHHITLGDQHRDKIHFLGYLQQEELALVMGAARALTYIPYFEGFGIPLVEAMYCGVPILAANATCLPEIAGNAAIYCDPFTLESIKSGMNEIMTDEAKLAQLKENALERGRLFSWDQSAEATWRVLSTTSDT